MSTFKDRFGIKFVGRFYKMELYFAPFEGISGYIYRNALHRHFGQIDKFFLPFILPNQFGKLSYKEKNDILPEHNEGMTAVPQILTNTSDDFLCTAKILEDYGYDEINLNLGCPSRTVVTKGRGAGFLGEPEKLDRFLDEIFDKITMKVSLKTRIGLYDAEEFDYILDIFNKYPVSELIVHPRLQKDMYKSTPDLETFETVLEKSKLSVCYNGDIFTKEDYDKFKERFPNVDKIMLGRGMLINPGLAREIRTGIKTDKMTLRAFHDEILEEYKKVLFGEKTVLFKMKEFWFYVGDLFIDSGKYIKKIRKSEKIAVYESVVEQLFAEKELR